MSILTKCTLCRFYSFCKRASCFCTESRWGAGLSFYDPLRARKEVTVIVIPCAEVWLTGGTTSYLPQPDPIFIKKGLNKGAGSYFLSLCHLICALRHIFYFILLFRFNVYGLNMPLFVKAVYKLIWV